MLQRFQPLVAGADFFRGQGAQFGVLVLLHGFSIRQRGFCFAVLAPGIGQLVDFRALPRQAAKPLLQLLLQKYIN